MHGRIDEDLVAALAIGEAEGPAPCVEALGHDLIGDFRVGHQQGPALRRPGQQRPDFVDDVPADPGPRRMPRALPDPYWTTLILDRRKARIKEQVRVSQEDILTHVHFLHLHRFEVIDHLPHPVLPARGGICGILGKQVMTVAHDAPTDNGQHRRARQHTPSTPRKMTHHPLDPPRREQGKGRRHADGPDRVVCFGESSRQR